MHAALQYDISYIGLLCADVVGALTAVFSSGASTGKYNKFSLNNWLLNFSTEGATVAYTHLALNQCLS